MFGYVNINKPEIRFKDYYRFRSYYCGVCGALGKRHGLLSRFSLGFDMTFLAVLLDGLYDCDTRVEQFRCPAHPLRKSVRRVNRYTDYASDMNLLLVWYKCMDDWADERKLFRRLYAAMISRKVKGVETRYPEKAQKIKEELEGQQAFERAHFCDRSDNSSVSENVTKDTYADSADGFTVTEIPDGVTACLREAEEAAGYFGRVLSEIFRAEDDAWTSTLSAMGFYLGKFIYLMDAYEDIFEDIKKGRYNPFSAICEREDFEETVEAMLRSMIAASAEQFELLPVDENMEILRNIIYTGVWGKYERISSERKGSESQEQRLLSDSDDDPERE